MPNGAIKIATTAERVKRGRERWTVSNRVELSRIMMMLKMSIRNVVVVAKMKRKDRDLRLEHSKSIITIPVTLAVTPTTQHRLELI